VVVGGDVHLSGHTVENGMLKTAPVKLGRGVTVGVGSVVGIGVEVGDRSQIGALSLVPKFTRLEKDGVYAGTPVRKLDTK
jgi:acetyltransferase-like isoleucine patch superfamily enzyme